MGTVGLMPLQESRCAAGNLFDGDLILLRQQDRSLLNSHQMAEKHLAHRKCPFVAYTLQAAIAARRR
jgi:predicted RNA polymerase sigma factor